MPVCEQCSRRIRVGAMGHHTADGCWLCEKCSPMLSDIIRDHRKIVEADDPDGMGELNYDNLEKLAAALKILEQDLAENGDRQFLEEAW